MCRSEVFLSVLLLLAMAVAPVVAESIDLTTFGQSTEQGRVARYTGFIGSATNHTACHLDGTPNGDPSDPNTYLGGYDYTSYPGSLATHYNGWWRMCDGVNDSTSEQPSGYNYFNDDRDPVEQFVGYRFKRPASISEINWTNYILAGGGTFAAPPRVEVLAGGPMESGGVWTQISVTGLESYDSSFSGTRINRNYTITPVGGPTSEVWGVRLIGDSQGGGGADTNGFIATGELQVLGASSMSRAADLTVNLALGQTPIWGAVAFAPGAPGNICDGNVLNQQGFFSATETGPDWVGVLFSSAQSDVAAVGLTQRMATDGGYFKPASMQVQYLPAGDDPNVEGNWVAVSGLDMARWGDMEPEVAAMAIATNRGYRHAELLTFDTIGSAIDGIRLYGDSAGTWQGKGFVAVAELEVFAVPEPSLLALLAGMTAVLFTRRK
jgi:hypothetical protein